MDAPLDEETRQLEKKLKLKLDFFILPLISMVYFFSFMGRTDLGNANIAGLSEELGLSNVQYSTAATTFLIGYCFFQLPGTLLLRMLGPNWQFGGAMIMWGLFTTLSVLIHNAASLLALRFLIGAAEAFIQGAVFYLSFWYTYQELATRGAIFFSTASLASSFNGLVSYGIAKNLNGKNGWLAWRWIFLVEGVMPIAASFLVLIFVPPTPETARFGFSKEEKALAVARGSRSHNDSEAKIEWKRIVDCLFDVHFWLMTITACAGHYCLSSLGNFLPAIIQGFGYDGVDSQLMSVIVYACAFVGTLFFARVADKTNARGATLAASSFVAVLGYALLIGLTGTKARLAATCIVAFGSYPNIVLNLSWLAMSVPGYTKRLVRDWKRVERYH
ncbi:MFS general substrate transporter [Melanomma pulvis-pyrius CBS 109.77]|uniref:MFS general substrate transporter n=1 Tax=Melanomma pulvis-pyrius CBS 109.77 TaxID=1314802 RepID=A0A6A6XZ91_9PLEO|nr:MFS general substrate transporter [Melanomma pulvis-pyrius CBS 109.77]